jgi:hypothetical protein
MIIFVGCGETEEGGKKPPSGEELVELLALQKWSTLSLS